MHPISPELTPAHRLSPRRRLALAIGGTLVLGVIAVAIAREHDEAVADELATDSVEFDLTSLSSAIREPSPARTEARPETSAVATDALRERVDHYLDARADALRQLDTARRQGVDPAVIGAMAAVLGMPAALPASDASTASAQDDAPQLAAQDDEPRAL